MNSSRKRQETYYLQSKERYNWDKHWECKEVEHEDRNQVHWDNLSTKVVHEDRNWQHWNNPGMEAAHWDMYFQGRVVVREDKNQPRFENKEGVHEDMNWPRLENKEGVREDTGWKNKVVVPVGEDCQHQDYNWDYMRVVGRKDRGNLKTCQKEKVENFVSEVHWESVEMCCEYLALCDVDPESFQAILAVFWI